VERYQIESMSPLDNPIWNALSSRHSVHAIGVNAAKRYPVAIAPFVAIAADSEEARNGVAEIVAPGEQFVMLAVMPPPSDVFRIVKSAEAFQYVWDGNPHPYEPDSEIEPLTDAHLGAMLELTALVYPAYFREGTAKLGQYFGVLKEGRLCAMAGIRMAMDGFQEISAVCTHPESRGQGYASRLTRHVVEHILAQGDTPFLHTESYNEAAQSVYTKLGFTRRAVLPLNLMERTGA